MSVMPHGEGCDPDQLFVQARAGDQLAWAALVERSLPKLLLVIRRRMYPRMRSVFDSTDFANDVYKSLVAKLDRFDFPNLGAVQAYLQQAAAQKVIDEYRRQETLKRGGGRTQRLEELRSTNPSYEPRASDPTPSQQFVAEETLEQLLSDVPDEKRGVVELKVQDFSNTEVAQRLGMHIRAVQRILKDLQSRRQERGEGES